MIGVVTRAFSTSSSPLSCSCIFLLLTDSFGFLPPTFLFSLWFYVFKQRKMKLSGQTKRRKKSIKNGAFCRYDCPWLNSIHDFIFSLAIRNKFFMQKKLYSIELLLCKWFWAVPCTAILILIWLDLFIPILSHPSFGRVFYI